MGRRELGDPHEARPSLPRHRRVLFAIAGVLVFGHDPATPAPLLIGTAQAIAGTLAGVAIGIVAALLGVAGGELLIPTLVLLFGTDIKLAGSLRLAVSLADNDGGIHTL